MSLEKVQRCSSILSLRACSIIAQVCVVLLWFVNDIRILIERIMISDFHRRSWQDNGKKKLCKWNYERCERDTIMIYDP